MANREPRDTQKRVAARSGSAEVRMAPRSRDPSSAYDLQVTPTFVTVENCTIFGMLDDAVRGINAGTSVVIRNTIAVGNGSQDFDLEGSEEN